MVDRGVGLHICVGIQLSLWNGKHKVIAGILHLLDYGVCLVLTYQVLFPTGDVVELVSLKAQFLYPFFPYQVDKIGVRAFRDDVVAPLFSNGTADNSAYISAALM